MIKWYKMDIYACVSATCERVCIYTVHVCRIKGKCRHVYLCENVMDFCFYIYTWYVQALLFGWRCEKTFNTSTAFLSSLNTFYVYIYFYMYMWTCAWAEHIDRCTINGWGAKDIKGNADFTNFIKSTVIKSMFSVINKFSQLRSLVRSQNWLRFTSGTHNFILKCFFMKNEQNLWPNFYLYI